MTPVAVIEKLERGDVFTRRIIFPEGLTIVEMAAIYEMRGFGSAADFATTARDATPSRGLDPSAPDLEGYLFPDTYALPRSASPNVIVAMMVDRFRAAYTEVRAGSQEADAPAIRESVTLASLVEQETGRDEERAIVAAVYRNQLRIGMAMQADPTVVYALVRAGRYDGNIRRDDLSVDSPRGSAPIRRFGEREPYRQRGADRPPPG